MTASEPGSSPIGSADEVIIVDLDGYEGRGPELVLFKLTATGLRVTIMGPLAKALPLHREAIAEESTNSEGVTS